jgi:hypothetical protein
MRVIFARGNTPHPSQILKGLCEPASFPACRLEWSGPLPQGAREKTLRGFA